MLSSIRQLVSFTCTMICIKLISVCMCLCVRARVCVGGGGGCVCTLSCVLHTRYFSQLTTGCGASKCTNKLCASSPGESVFNNSDTLLNVVVKSLWLRCGHTTARSCKEEICIGWVYHHSFLLLVIAYKHSNHKAAAGLAGS